MATWLQDIQAAMRNLGGIAAYRDLYPEVGRLRGITLSSGDQATVRKEIERSSSDSENWQRKADFFYSVKGIGAGVWGLRVEDKPTPSANDLALEELDSGTENPGTSVQHTFRIIRETTLARQLKRLHHHECQLCSKLVMLADGTRYSEGHHLRPLGRPHHGPDIPANIIVLCPTCHVLLDYFAIPITTASIRAASKHAIGTEYIAYHNEQHRLVSRAANLNTFP